MATFEITTKAGTYQIDAPDEHAAMSALKAVGGDQEAPVTAEGLAKAGGTGIVKGGLGMAEQLAGASNNPLLMAIAKTGALKPKSTQAMVERFVTGPLHEPQNRAERYAETVGEFVPGAVATGPAGVARAGLAAGLKSVPGNLVRYGAAPGAASEAAGEAAQGSGLDKLARGAAGVGTALLFAKRGAGAAVPSREELFKAADEGYSAMRGSGAEYKAGAVSDLASGTATKLNDGGISSEVAPLTHRILEKLQNAPKDAAAVPVGGLEQARQVLNAISSDALHFGKHEGRAARMAIADITDFIGKADPRNVSQGLGKAALEAQIAAERAARSVADARGNYAAASRSNTIGARDYNAGLQADAAHSGANLDNALRQNIKSLLRKDDKGISEAQRSGFSKEEISALESFIKGGVVRDTLRTASNAMGGGRGVAAGLYGMAGAAMGGLKGLGVGMIPVAGAALKAGQNKLSEHALAVIDEIVRRRSPLYASRARGNPAESMVEGYARVGAPAFGRLGY